MSAKRIKSVFDAIPGQLAKHEKKLVYSQIAKESRARDYVTALGWLREAATVNLCTLSEDPSLGLALSEDASVVKCYMADTGLLATMAFASKDTQMPAVYKQVLGGDAHVNEGMLAENAVAQQLATSGHPLHFYSQTSKDSGGRMEIDFLVVRPFADAAMKPRVSPVEVKSGKQYPTASLEKFRGKFTQRVGAEYLVYPKPLSVESNRIKLPLYMAHLL